MNENYHAVNPTVLFFTDLDGTLIFSRRHLLLGPLRCVEEFRGSMQSFMTELTWRFFREQEFFTVIPITMRTTAQYRRLLPMARALHWEDVLVCGGAKLLHHGIEDPAWTEDSLCLCESNRAEWERVRRLAVEQEGEAAIVTEAPFLFYLKTDQPEKICTYLKQEADPQHLQIFCDARKVYVLPASLDKGEALARYRRRHPALLALAAGDSEPDFTMLRQADIRFCLPKWKDSMDNDDGGNTIFCGEIFSDAITEKMRKIMELYEIRCGDLVRVAKRENNTKRSYLYVNPRQGKHMPVSPSSSLTLFRLLAARVEARYRNERLLIIGFAETATAIGFAVAEAAENAAFVMSTTRENIPGGEYLFFSESHSHATEQRLVRNHLEEVLPQIDRVVFVEDEVTTGNTIRKLIHALQEEFPEESFSFGIASLVNSMTDNRLQKMEADSIPCDYLLRISPEYHSEWIPRYTYRSPVDAPFPPAGTPGQPAIEIPDCANLRVVRAKSEIHRLCERFVAEAAAQLEKPSSGEHILILGTEEFMYPGMLLGRYLEKVRPDLNVSFHALTRSPIEVSGDPDYPLHLRNCLNSLYEDGRVNYIYNLDFYQQVYVVTDAEPLCEAGWESLLGALEAYGSKKIRRILWRNE